MKQGVSSTLLLPISRLVHDRPGGKFLPLLYRQKLSWYRAVTCFLCMCEIYADVGDLVPGDSNKQQDLEV